jgi:hypothetical protein
LVTTLRLPPDMAGWPCDHDGRPLMRCPDATLVGHVGGHWWFGQLRNRNLAAGVRALYCPTSTVGYGRSE